MISQKLFEEVMQYDGSYSDYNTEQIMDDCETLNIHALANKCKQWAYEQGYFLTSKQAISHITNKLCYKVSIEPTEYNEYVLVGDTEPEAIFKACEWILERKENK